MCIVCIYPRFRANENSKHERSTQEKMSIVCRIGASKFFNYVQCSYASMNVTCLRKIFERQLKIQNLCLLQCNVYSNNVKSQSSEIGNESVAKTKKKKVFVPRVTLLTEDNEMSIVTLEVAEKMANRRNMKLVKIVDFDTKTERPTYKLMSSTNYIQQELEQKKKKRTERDTTLKPEKLLSLSTKINDHDLQTKLKSVVKFITKKHEVRILITIDNNKEKAEAICTQIQTVVKDFLPTITKTVSNNSMKIYLRPNETIDTPVPMDKHKKDKDAKTIDSNEQQ